MRKILGTAAATILAISLTACAPASQAQLIDQLSPVCKPFSTGKALASMKADSNLKIAPNATVDAGVTSTQIETKVITEGTGPKIVGNQLITIEYQGINGGTGKTFQATKFNDTDTVQQYLTPDGKPDFCHALTGVRVGSRVAVLFPAKIAHAGAGIPSYGVGPTDSVVFVMDIVRANLPHALGTTGTLQNGFPAISFDPTTGGPGYTWSKSAAPSTLRVEKLIVGNGDTVDEGDTITLNYSGIVYGGTSVFDSSWDKGQPAQFVLNKGGLIDGFYKTLIGAHVGDRIVSMIPPRLGYGSTANSSIPANSTLVFVIDVLGTHK